MQNLTVHFNHKPLRLSKSLVTSDSVPGRQTFDAAAGGHIPDYTLTPLILQPLVGYTDPDGIIPSGAANSRLADIAWQQYVHDPSNPDGGAWAAIQTTDPDFGMVTQSNPDGNPYETEGGTAGRLYVRKNADPGYPLMLRFSALFVDPRTLQTSRIDMDYTVICDNATPPEASVSLDCSHLVYNPLTDPDVMTVSATVNSANGLLAPGADCLLVWEYRTGGAWRELNPAPGSGILRDPLDYWLDVAPDGASIDIDRSMMPEDLYLRCRLRHSYLAKPWLEDANGNPDKTALNPAFDTLAPDAEAAPHAVCVIIRRVPELAGEGILASSVPSDARSLLAQGCVRLRSGAVIRDTLGVLRPLWKVGTNTANGGGVTMKVVSTEMTTLLDTADMHATHGMQVRFDAEDCGPLVPLTDSDGAILTDDDGSILLFH